MAEQLRIAQQEIAGRIADTQQRGLVGRAVRANRERRAAERALFKEQTAIVKSEIAMQSAPFDPTWERPNAAQLAEVRQDAAADIQRLYDQGVL